MSDTVDRASGAERYKYDIAVSFAGEQRQFVEDVVRGLGLPKGRVFYDADSKAALWGEELTEVFTNLYRDEARYVVMFISREYAEKEWCRLERRAALTRRLQTQSAYILPVRLDSTKLDDVAGLVSSIGDLDGVREGVQGVIECLREKLSIAQETATAVSDEDDEPEIGVIARNPAGLTDLLQRRPHSWQWAAFGSVLVQRKQALSSRVRDHQLGYAKQTDERINDVAQLVSLTSNSMRDVEQTGQLLASLILTPAFQAAFGEPNNLAQDPDAIVHTANRVMDFYERYLQLAERIRGVSAPADYINVLENCARLSDKPLAGMDNFIESYAKVVDEMPKLLKEAGGTHIIRPVEIKLHVDNELLEEILRQLKDIIDQTDDDD
ncbi:TIR domain-containing protein [Mycobacteroides abscessus]|uniref:TIR domain-containing protein n=1 Tax=Mycobacteroides abscessus TaxID=36809 RepID=UPI00189660B2